MHMKGKTCVVTGANAGIGFETALSLATQGAHVIMLCRNPDKAATAREEILSRSGNEAVEVVQVDLSRQASIRSAASTIADRHPRIDVLVNNAGTWFSKRVMTEDGVEMVFAVNHLAYFLLTHLLMPQLLAAPHARVVCVGSDSHFQVKGIQFDDLMMEKSYHGLRSYAQSKLANCMFVYELHRQLREAGIHQVDINCLQPGLVKTAIGFKHTFSLHALAWWFRRNMGGISPAEGAATSIYLASSEEALGQSGLYWDRSRPKASSEASQDAAAMQQLWHISMDLCGISHYLPLELDF